MTRLRTLILSVLAVTLLACASGQAADVTVGRPAPDFSVKDTHGKAVQLSNLKGRYVVLEWWNHGCPFVQGQYDAGKMQAQQKRWTADGVVWVVVCSSAPGKQGAVSADEADRLMKEKGASPTHVVLDPTGDLGRKYGARTTPHMFVVDPQGTLIYNGAIDDRGSKNYVEAALAEAKAGKKVASPVTQPYGCSVKYAK